ncbi:MAG: hypothetical protein HUJ30_01510, partial [Gammaproteobacteria bacterium]|nr:hypothetical protein [Gammaproteobacteria bacterium]
MKKNVIKGLILIAGASLLTGCSEDGGFNADDASNAASLVLSGMSTSSTYYNQASSQSGEDYSVSSIAEAAKQYDIGQHLNHIIEVTESERTNSTAVSSKSLTVKVPVTDNCISSGTYTIDSANNTVGDDVNFSFSLSYSNCSNDGSTIWSGSISGTVTGSVATGTRTISYTYDNFGVVFGADNISINGSINASVIVDGSLVVQSASLSIPSFVMSGTINGQGGSFSITNYSADMTNTGSDWSMTVSGTIDDSIAGTVSITTLETVYQDYYSLFPYQGKIGVNYNGTDITITYLTGDSYTVAADG